MASTYTGSPTATQAPDTAPEPDKAPVGNLPADGDALNVSSIHQAFKDALDHIAWLFKPRAKTSDWAKWIMAWRSAAQHKRHLVDHLGFFGGQVIEENINWKYTSVTGESSESGSADTQLGTMPEWRYKGVQTSGTSAVSMGFFSDGAGGHSFPLLYIRAGNTATDYAAFISTVYCAFTDKNHIALSFLAGIETGHANRDLWIGLCEYVTGSPSAQQEFIGFQKQAGSANWFCCTRTGGVQTTTDSGVAASTATATKDRLRVEWHGATVADNATRAVRFYVNGTLVATHTTNLPLNKGCQIFIGDVNVTGVANALFGLVGPMKFRASIFDSDVA